MKYIIRGSGWGIVLKTEQDYNRITPDKKSPSVYVKNLIPNFLSRGNLTILRNLNRGVAVVVGAFVVSNNETKANKLRYAQQQEFEKRMVDRQEEQEDLERTLLACLWLVSYEHLWTRFWEDPSRNGA